MSYFKSINIKDADADITANVKTNTNTTNNELLVNLEGHQCLENSTTDQLTASGIYTGSGWQDTIDYGVLSINVASDQDSAVDGLDVQWSNDGVNVSDHDYFTITANVSKTFTFGPAQRYYRIVYTNGTGGTTTTFHLTSLLRRVYVKPSSHRINDPIVGEDDAELIKAVTTGETDDGEFLNIRSTFGGSMKVSQEDGQTATRLQIDPLGSMKSITPVRLVGTAFNNGTKDPNFWTDTVTGTGSVTQAGEITLSTGTTADSSAKYTSVRKARKVPGTVNQFRMVGRLTTDPQADNVRRAGPYSVNDGYFFQYDGTTFGVGSRKSTVDTVVENGSFNGNYGATIDVTGTSLYRFNIDYTAISARFFINDVLLHTMTFPIDSGTNTVDFPITLENYNENGNTTDNSFQLRFATILRLGELITNPISKYMTTGTHVLKYGAGILQRIIVGDNVSGSVTIYDNTAGSGTELTVLDTAVGSSPLGSMEYNIPFNNGLTIVIVGNNKITVSYE